MFDKLFGKKPEKDPLSDAPSIMGLGLRGSFEVDPLLLKLIGNELVTQGSASTHIIKAAGVDSDDLGDYESVSRQGGHGMRRSLPCGLHRAVQR